MVMGWASSHVVVFSEVNKQNLPCVGFKGLGFWFLAHNRSRMMLRITPATVAVVPCSNTFLDYIIMN